MSEKISLDSSAFNYILCKRFIFFQYPRRCVKTVDGTQMTHPRR